MMKLFKIYKKLVHTSQKTNTQDIDSMKNDGRAEQLAELRLELKHLQNELKKYSPSTTHYQFNAICLYYHTATVPFPVPCANSHTLESAYYRHQQMKYTQQIAAVEAKITALQHAAVDDTTNDYRNAAHI
jgi:hypothetical protein